MHADRAKGTTKEHRKHERATRGDRAQEKMEELREHEARDARRSCARGSLVNENRYGASGALRRPAPQVSPPNYDKPGAPLGRPLPGLFYYKITSR